MSKTGKDTPWSILKSHNINTKSQAGQWLLLCLQEKESNPESFSPAVFYKVFTPKDSNGSPIMVGYKVMPAAAKKNWTKPKLKKHLWISWMSL